jgi:hypothetical protein
VGQVAEIPVIEILFDDANPARPEGAVDILGNRRLPGSRPATNADEDAFLLERHRFPPGGSGDNFRSGIGR